MTAYQRLPKELLDRASLRGNEYAWRVDDIPHVISAARDANLLNVGGQLQFRPSDGGTCECYWINVDTLRSMPGDKDWESRVAQSAITARADFRKLQTTHDFAGEGRRAFDKHLTDNHLDAVMWFVWYLEDQE